MASLIEPRSLLMQDVDWPMYDHLLRELDHGSTRMVYDRGRLTIFKLSIQHCFVSKSASRLLETLATENDWTLNGYGNVTLRRHDLLIGLEPDECYYIETPPPSASRGELDLTFFPPPDLAIEVEITKSSIGKESIYDQIGVQEIFRWTGEQFIVLERDETGQYAQRTGSTLLPNLSIDLLSELTRLAIATDQTTAVRALQERLRSASGHRG